MHSIYTAIDRISNFKEDFTFTEGRRLSGKKLDTIVSALET